MSVALDSMTMNAKECHHLRLLQCEQEERQEEAQERELELVISLSTTPLVDCEHALGIGGQARRRGLEDQQECDFDLDLAAGAEVDQVALQEEDRKDLEKKRTLQKTEA